MKSLAEVAYEAWRQRLESRARSTPLWENLLVEQKDAWRASIQAVAGVIIDRTGLADRVSGSIDYVEDIPTLDGWISEDESEESLSAAYDQGHADGVA